VQEPTTQATRCDAYDSRALSCKCLQIARELDEEERKLLGPGSDFAEPGNLDDSGMFGIQVSQNRNGQYNLYCKLSIQPRVITYYTGWAARVLCVDDGIKGLG
jgi:hypothetical protein